jgi:magnesium-transporting ATPase (P-type)
MRAVCDHCGRHHLPGRLGLATPTTIMVGTGLDARRRILFNNAIVLETVARIDTAVIMDKTGTLTREEPVVTDIVVASAGAGETTGARAGAEDELLGLVAAMERESEHPLAAAVARYAQVHGIPQVRAEEFANLLGHGAVAITLRLHFKINEIPPRMEIAKLTSVLATHIQTERFRNGSLTGTAFLLVVLVGSLPRCGGTLFGQKLSQGGIN